MKVATFFFLFTRHVFPKLLAICESLIKVKVMSHWTLFVILLTPAVNKKQRLLHRNETVQHLQNSKCYNVSQDHFRNSLKVLSLNDPFNFLRLFNFRLLSMFSCLPYIDQSTDETAFSGEYT